MCFNAITKKFLGKNDSSGYVNEKINRIFINIIYNICDNINYHL